MIITIDGPTASGKSTLARALAAKLGFYYIYSGLLFRALASILLYEKKFTMDQLADVTQADINCALDPGRFEYRYTNGKEQILWNGRDIAPTLKTPELDQAASILSTNKHVRTILMKLQRIIASSHDVVVDGRDTGSIVFPNADFKFYLTASQNERARRWLDVHKKNGVEHNLNHAINEIAKRDERDTTREHDPLIIPADAHIIDNSNLTQQETFETILDRYVKG